MTEERERKNKRERKRKKRKKKGGWGVRLIACKAANLRKPGVLFSDVCRCLSTSVMEDYYGVSAGDWGPCARLGYLSLLIRKDAREID